MNKLAINNKVESWVKSFEEIIKIQEQIKELVHKQEQLGAGILEEHYKIKDTQRKAWERTWDLSGMMKKFTDHLNKNFWNSLFSKTKINNLVTSEVKRDLELFQEKSVKLEFNQQNVYTVFESLSRSQETIAYKAITRAYDRMTREHKNRDGKYGFKTNEQFKVGDKVVLSWFSEDLVNDIEKALCILTGKNWQDIKKMRDALTFYHIVDSPHTGQWMDSEFFSVKQFKKGSLHLKWKDSKIKDLFNKTACQMLNQIGN